VALGGSFLLIMVCLIFTYSRSAWFGTLAGAAVVLGFWKARGVLVLPIVALLALMVLPGSFRERLASAFDPAHPSNVERVNMWTAGVRIVRDHPWTGVGDIGLGEIYARYRPPGAREQASHLHDNLIMIAVTLGIPGALIVIALFVRILMLLVQNARTLATTRGPPRGLALGSLAGVVGFLVMGIFEWNLGDAEAAMMLWFVIGLSIAAARMAEDGEVRRAGT
jgi:O-antigen ligase